MILVFRGVLPWDFLFPDLQCGKALLQGLPPTHFLLFDNSTSTFSYHITNQSNLIYSNTDFIPGSLSVFHLANSFTFLILLSHSWSSLCDDYLNISSMIAVPECLHETHYFSISCFSFISPEYSYCTTLIFWSYLLMNGYLMSTTLL